MASRAEIVMAPAKSKSGYKTSIFLAGPTTPTGEPDWQETLSQALSSYPITIFNPKRFDWDSTWREDFSDENWTEQIQWELGMQDAASIVVVFFHSFTVAPIALLELGLCVKSGRAIVCALDGYSKRGNVEAVCRRHGAPFVRTVEELKDAVVKRLKDLGVEPPIPKE